MLQILQQQRLTLQVTLRVDRLTPAWRGACAGSGGRTEAVEELVQESPLVRCVRGEDLLQVPDVDRGGLLDLPATCRRERRVNDPPVGRALPPLHVAGLDHAVEKPCDATAGQSDLLG